MSSGADDPVNVPPRLTHVDEAGRARMVDVTAKAETAREAEAEAFVEMAPETMALLVGGRLPKGEAIATARIAGIQAAKKCGDLIPLCHPLALESVEVAFEPEPDSPQRARLRITATTRITAKTGVEMEALAAVSVAALTIYDMCKGVDRTMRIDGIRLLRKTGGKHGFQAP